MKFIKLLLGLLFINLLMVSCSNNDDSVTPPVVIINPIPDPDPIPDLEITGETLIHNTTLADPGYVLVAEVTNHRVYLISKEEGAILYEWDLPSKIGNDAELMPNGKLLIALKTEFPEFTIGGFGGRIQIINPDGSIDWDFEYSNGQHIAHHDVELLPNGNVLILAWQSKTIEESTQAGYIGTDDINYLLAESLIEVNPNTNEIVWEWHSWDHLVQDFDNTKANFDDVSLNPQLININYAPRADGDIMHANGMDYDPVKDIIYLSVNFYNEVWVIDHSTSTVQASTGLGGNYNKGGDLIYRFGNPSAYNNTEGNQIFFKNHFPNLLEGNEIGAGNVLIYMNGNVDFQSIVFELTMPESFNLLPNHNNEPDIFWEFKDPDMFSPLMGSALRLPNGNTLIAEPGFGFWEVTPSSEVVWKFQNDFIIWRAYGYPTDHPGILALGL